MRVRVGGKAGGGGRRSARMMQRKHFSFVITMPAADQSPLSHFDASGQAHMVDVAAKAETHRVARASGVIRMLPATLALIESASAAKGDVLGVARIAAIQGAKRTAELVPLCHPMPITRVARRVRDRRARRARCAAPSRSRRVGRTGVEMEALTAVQVGLLTIYDMCKAADRGMVMGEIRVLEKRGGKSGDWVAAAVASRRSPEVARSETAAVGGGWHWNAAARRCGRAVELGRPAKNALGLPRCGTPSGAPPDERALSVSPRSSSALAQATIRRASSR